MKDFSIVQTGGGCTALSYDFGDGRYLLITNLSGCLPPQKETDLIYVGLYDVHREGFGEVEVHMMESLTDFKEIWHTKGGCKCGDGSSDSHQRCCCSGRHC